jgi:hypothetical protein
MRKVERKPITRIALTLILSGVIGLGASAYAQSAPPPGGSLRIVGNKDQIQVVEKDGTVQTLEPGTVVLLNRSAVSTPIPVHGIPSSQDQSQEEQVQPEQASSETAPGAQTGLEEPKPSPAPKAGGRARQTAGVETDKSSEPQESEAENAAKQAAMETISRIRAYGGAWFFTSDGNPVSDKEVDERVQAGEVDGIRVVDLWQQPTTPLVKPEEAQEQSVQRP